MKQNKVVAGILKTAADMIDDLQLENERLKKEASESSEENKMLDNFVKLAKISKASVIKLASTDQGLVELSSLIHKNYTVGGIGEETDEVLFFDKNASVLSKNTQSADDWADFDENAYFESLLEEI